MEKDTNIKRRLEIVNFGPGFYDSISPALKNVYLITLSTTFHICILFDILFWSDTFISKATVR